MRTAALALALSLATACGTDGGNTIAPDEFTLWYGHGESTGDGAIASDKGEPRFATSEDASSDSIGFALTWALGPKDPGRADRERLNRLAAEMADSLAEMSERLDGGGETKAPGGETKTDHGETKTAHGEPRGRGRDQGDRARRYGVFRDRRDDVLGGLGGLLAAAGAAYLGRDRIPGVREITRRRRARRARREAEAAEDHEEADLEEHDLEC